MREMCGLHNPGVREMTELHSIRMRASQGGPHERGGKHISGAEKIGQVEDLPRLAGELVRRALSHQAGTPDHINITVEKLPQQVKYLASLPVTTIAVQNPQEGGEAARRILLTMGIAPKVIEQALALLEKGPAPGGGTMRGALLLDAVTGERLEQDPRRGIRVSRMDLTCGAAQQLEESLARSGLAGTRIREALVLASKVAAHPGVIAELCYSDNPDYQAGYVAGAAVGYVRFPFLKPPGAKGGRVFFISPGTDIAELERYLTREPVLVDSIGPINPVINL